MPRQRQTSAEETTPARKPTPTFLLELPLQVTAGQAKRLRARMEAARQLYNAVLSEGQRRLRRMRADPGWPAARAVPRLQKQERKRAFGELRRQYGFSEYALHEAVKGLNGTWIADHVDAVLAQTLATRAYRALNRVCLGQARRVRFKSRGRGLSSVENKRADTGLRAATSGGMYETFAFTHETTAGLKTHLEWKGTAFGKPVRGTTILTRNQEGPTRTDPVVSQPLARGRGVCPRTGQASGGGKSIRRSCMRSDTGTLVCSKHPVCCHMPLEERDP